MDQSDTGITGRFSPRTSNRTQESRVDSHHGPIGHRNHGYILTTDQSDTGIASRLSPRTDHPPQARAPRMTATGTAVGWRGIGGPAPARGLGGPAPAPRGGGPSTGTP
eukprot:1181941-Prorocentrum_minimum.AAC.2